MWFVFPQIAGLGRSSTARYYAIASQAEAEAYLLHPTLGPRLRECTDIVNAIQNRSARQIFGSPDDMKFCSSMTLFQVVSSEEEPFKTALEKYYNAKPDQSTLTLLDRA